MQNSINKYASECKSTLNAIKVIWRAWKGFRLRREVEKRVENRQKTRQVEKEFLQIGSNTLKEKKKKSLKGNTPSSKHRKSIGKGLIDIFSFKEE